jgi:16S rRNA (uracil1498-N3)-methyltransferase
MTAPLFLVEPAALCETEPGSEVVLDGPEGHHAASVVRLRLGETVLLADGQGRLVLAEVVASTRHTVTTRVRAVSQEPAPDPSFVLVQALAKGGRDEQAVEAATELGVDEVVPWRSARSVVQWRGERAAKGVRAWEALVRAAAKQSRRARVPAVADLAGQADVERLLSGAALGLVLHEDAGMPLAGVPLPDMGRIVVVVGPEGGIAQTELAAFVEAGGRPVRLGREVLRASSAGPAALAVINAAGRWREPTDDVGRSRPMG